MKDFFRKEWLFIYLLIIPLAVAFILYPSMPEQVPTHWNTRGEVDQYSSREFGTFFLPVLNIGLYVLLVVTPKLDPKRMNYEKFFGTYKFMRYAIHLFFVLMFAVTVSAALGHAIDIGLWIPAGISVLFILLGNIMSRVRHNYFVGFRFPWTLANEEVWRKTHLLGSKLMVAGGIFSLIFTFLTNNNLRFIGVMTGLLSPMMISFVYSYLLYKKISDAK
ncbi:MAG: SdpI family protein [Bacillota bacterium]